MAEIVPRWEWRAFGEHFGAAEDRFAALEPERIQESDELYLLSRLVDENVKVRDDLLDVKELEHVNRDGLEQWTPVLKASFPMPAAELEGVLARLRAARRRRRGTSTRSTSSSTSSSGPSGELLAVQVHKRRQRYTIGGCTTELTVAADRRRRRRARSPSSRRTRSSCRRPRRELGLEARAERRASPAA